MSSGLQEAALWLSQFLMGQFGTTGGAGLWKIKYNLSGVSTELTAPRPLHATDYTPSSPPLSILNPISPTPDKWLQKKDNSPAEVAREEAAKHYFQKHHSVVTGGFSDDLSLLTGYGMRVRAKPESDAAALIADAQFIESDVKDSFIDSAKDLFVHRAMNGFFRLDRGYVKSTESFHDIVAPPGTAPGGSSAPTEHGIYAIFDKPSIGTNGLSYVPTPVIWIDPTKMGADRYDTICHELLHYVFDKYDSPAHINLHIDAYRSSKDSADHAFIGAISDKIHLVESVRLGKFHLRTTTGSPDLAELGYRLQGKSSYTRVLAALDANRAPDLELALNHPEFVSSIIGHKMLVPLLYFSNANGSQEFRLSGPDFQDIMYVLAQYAVIVRRMFLELTVEQEKLKKAGTIRTLKQIMNGDPGADWSSRVIGFVGSLINELLDRPTAGVLDVERSLPKAGIPAP